MWQREEFQFTSICGRPAAGAARESQCCMLCCLAGSGSRPEWPAPHTTPLHSTIRRVLARTPTRSGRVVSLGFDAEPEQAGNGGSAPLRPALGRGAARRMMMALDGRR